MLRKWVRLLPYGLVMRILRNQYSFNGYGTLKIGKSEYSVCYFQVSEGEFVCYLEELQKVFDQRKKEKRDAKVDKKLEKINKQLRKDYLLQRKLKEQFEDEDID